MEILLNYSPYFLLFGFLAFYVTFIISCIFLAVFGITFGVRSRYIKVLRKVFQVCFFNNLYICILSLSNQYKLGQQNHVTISNNKKFKILSKHPSKLSKIITNFQNPSNPSSPFKTPKQSNLKTFKNTWLVCPYSS